MTEPNPAPSAPSTSIPLVLDRADDILQVGLDPAVLVAGSEQGTSARLRLSGTRWAVEELLRQTAAETLDPQLVHELLADLALAAPTPDERQGAPELLLVGAGTLADTVAQTLEPLARRLTCRGWSVAPDPFVGAGPPDLVVLVSSGATPSMLAEPWRALGVPHLPVVCRGRRVVVGPLVEPGGQGPCLWCLDLFRCDHDPGWPGILRQLSSPTLLARGSRTHPATTALAAGMVAMLVHARSSGLTLAPGLTLESALPEPAIVRRRWRQHPRCRCSKGQRATA